MEGSGVRTIKREFFRHEELFEAEKDSGLPLRVAFAGLFCCCDDEGKFLWKPSSLKLDVIPYDCVDMSAVLDQLESHRFIIRHDEDGCLYGIIPTFKKHQICGIIVKPKPKTRKNNKRQYDPSIPAHEVLEYLRQKTGTNFKFIDSTLVHIIRRLSEPDVTVDDCKKVIDFKCKEWGSDPIWSRFLRPATLFIPSHFYEYLAASQRPEIKQKNKLERAMELLEKKGDI